MMSDERYRIRHLKLSVLMHARGKEKSCTSHKGYTEIRHAIAACRSKPGFAHIAYQCLFCGKYHVDHRVTRDEFEAYETSYQRSTTYTDRAHFCEMCGGKARFSTRLLAAATALYHRETGHMIGQTDVYHCHHCGGWHIGHSTERDMLAVVA